MEDYLNKTLLPFSDSPHDVWTVEEACKGISIIGGTGSGKTSGSGRVLAKTFLLEGWGGLVLCAKPDEAKRWINYCEETGRKKDLIVFGKGSIHTEGEYKGQEIVFNALHYEMSRDGKGAGETQNITNIFMTLFQMGNRIAGEGDNDKGEQFWHYALIRCLNRIIELIKLSGEDLTYQNMVRILSSSNNVTSDRLINTIVQVERGEAPEELSKTTNYCLRCLVKAYHNVIQENTPDERINAFDLVEDYFVNALPNLGSRTKSVITESFFGLAERFLSGVLYRHFTGTNNIFPELTYEQNKIIVLDFPVKDFLEAGVTAQCVFKLMFQQAIERRDIEKYPAPVFLYGDEIQYFITPYDQLYLTTARSARAVTCYLTQSMSNYYAIMGSGSDAKARVDALMGNLSTKIFHANSDAVTNEYSSTLIGSDITYLSNVGKQQNHFSMDFTKSEGISSQFLPQIQPREFTVLKSGGEMNDYKVQAVIMVSGRQWSNGKNYLKTTFTQKFKTLNNEK